MYLYVRKFNKINISNDVHYSGHKSSKCGTFINTITIYNKIPIIVGRSAQDPRGVPYRYKYYKCCRLLSYFPAGRKI